MAASGCLNGLLLFLGSSVFLGSSLNLRYQHHSWHVSTSTLPSEVQHSGVWVHSSGLRLGARSHSLALIIFSAVNHRLLMMIIPVVNS